MSILHIFCEQTHIWRYARMRVCVWIQAVAVIRMLLDAGCFCTYCSNRYAFVWNERLNADASRFFFRVCSIYLSVLYYTHYILERPTLRDRQCELRVNYVWMSLISFRRDTSTYRSFVHSIPHASNWTETEIATYNNCELSVLLKIQVLHKIPTGADQHTHIEQPSGCNHRRRNAFGKSVQNTHIQNGM